MACLALLSTAAPAASSAAAGPTRSTTANLDAKRYVAAGTRAYVIGAESGRFPPMGWHIRGEMGGVWAHPVKLLDGYWFALDGTWLGPAARFTSGPGYVRMRFPATNGVVMTRTELSPDRSPLVLVRLTLRNTEARRRSVLVTMDARSDILAAYPWGWTEPSARDFNEQDVGAYDPATGTLEFRETGKPWHAKISAPSHRPVFGATGAGYWGPVAPGERSEYFEYGDPPAVADKGTTGTLTWRLVLPARGSSTLWVGIAGSHVSEAETERGFERMVGAEDLLARKIAERRALLRRTAVRLPDRRLRAAFDWGKLNMADLRRTTTHAQIRDVDEGKAYPPAAASFRVLHGIGAGYPDYPWYFGTDGAYTAFPLVASGQWQTASDHLRTIKQVSRALNGATGKVVHEVMTDGSVYFGTRNHRGNTNETAQFAVAVDLLWRWSGNNRFRDEMYGFVRDGLRYITSPGCPIDPDPEPPEGTCDTDRDGWPDGSGMVERTGMGQEKLDVAAYTWQALRALARMARSKGDAATAGWATATARALRRQLDAAWWLGSEPLYADSLCDPPKCAQTNTKLQQLHWINATPAEARLAPRRRAHALLDRLESPTFTGSCGLLHTGVGGGPEGKGELKCWTLPNSVLAVGEANYGRLGPSQALYYMRRGIADQLDLEMPGALPEIAPSPEYDPFDDYRERAMFMQAWSPYGIHWPIVHHFLGVDADVPARRLFVVPDIPDAWGGLSVRNLRIARGALSVRTRRVGDRYTTSVRAPRRLWLVLGQTLPAGAGVRGVRLDGRAVRYRVVSTTRGREVRVLTRTNAPHRLVVLAR